MANNEISRTEMEVFALGFTAKKQLIEAGIDSKYVDALASSEVWNGEESEALNAFITAYQAAKAANETEVTEKLAQALENVKAARDIVLNSEDGVLNDLAALEAKIQENYDAWQLEAIAVQTRLKLKRDQISTDFGSLEDYTDSYAAAHTNALLSDGSYKLLVTMPTEYTLGNLQDELDPSYNGTAVSGDTFGWLPLPAGVETLEAAKEHYGIEGDKIILEQNFDYMKEVIALAEADGNFTTDGFSFAPYNELGLPAPDAHPEVLAGWHWKLKADQKFKVGTVVGVSSTTDTIYGTIDDGNKIYTEGTAAVAGDDWKMHTGIDFSSTQNPFHLLPTDMDYVNASLIFSNEGVKKIFFREDVPGVVDITKSAKMGIKIFQNWMEQKGFIASQTTEAYDSEKHDITPYGSISVRFNANADVDEAVFNTARTHIMDVMFGWNMDKMREENNTLHTLLTHLVWSSFQLYFDYQIAEFNQTPGSDGYPQMRLRQSNGGQISQTLHGAKYQGTAQSYYDGSTNTVISAFDGLGFNWDTLKDVESFGSMGPQLMHMFDYPIYISHLNYLYNNHHPTNLMPVRTTLQKVEFGQNYGRIKLLYDLAEYDKAVAGDYKIHVPRVEGIGGMTTQEFEDFAVEDEVYCEMMDYIGRGMSPLYGFNTASPVMRNEEDGYVDIRLNASSYLSNYFKFNVRWIKSSAEGVVLQDTNKSQTIPLIHFDKSEVTLDKIAEFEALIEDGTLTNYYDSSNYNCNKFYFLSNANSDWNVVSSAIKDMFGDLKFTWFEAINHNIPFGRPMFAGNNPNNYTHTVTGGDGLRNIETGEIIDESNALDYTGFQSSQSNILFPYWFGGKNMDNTIWGGTLKHLASDFVPSYAAGFNWNAYFGETIFYGAYAGSSGQINPFKPSVFDIYKNIPYDPDMPGKLLPTIAPEDRYYTYNGNPFQLPEILELDSEGNYTAIDPFGDEFLNKTHYSDGKYWSSTNAVEIQNTPTDFLEWLTIPNANQSITVHKIAKDSNGKVFNQMVAHPNQWIKDGDSFTMMDMPSELMNGMIGKGFLQGNNNPLQYIFNSNTHNWFRQTPMQQADANDKRDTVEFTINFPAFMDIEGVSYTKPKNSGLFTPGFANNGGAYWNDDMLGVFEYWHKLIRRIIGKKDPVTGNTIKIPDTPVNEWRTKVITEGALWGDYFIKDMINDETWGFAMTGELQFFDPKIEDLIRNHSNVATSAVYWTYMFYKNLYLPPTTMAMDADFTLNSDGSVVMDVTKPFLLFLNKASQTDTVGFQSPYFLDILDINETSIGEGDNMTWVQDWDVSIYQGHAYNVENDLSTITSDSRWDGNSIFNTASAGEKAITEPGGDGVYFKYQFFNQQSVMSTNSMLWGDIDMDGDGICNLIEDFPESAQEVFDADKDGVGNFMDQFPFSPTAQWSVLEDKDGNQYAVAGNMGQRGWPNGAIKILDLPPFIEDEFNNTGLITVDQHDITGTHILKYVSSQLNEPTDMPKLNLNHVTDVKMIHSTEEANNIFDGMHHIKGELTGYYVNPNDSSQALGEYSYSNIGVLSAYIDEFTNGTATFEHAEDYLEAKAGVTTVTVNVRLGDGYGDGAVNASSTLYLVNASTGEIIQSVAAVNGYTGDGEGYDKWNNENQFITAADGSTTKLFNASGKEAWVCFQNVELEPGSYLIRLTGDAYANSESGIAITTGTLGGAETYLTGYGIVASNSQGALTRNAEDDYPFTIS